MKRNKEIATFDVHVSDRSGGSRRRLAHGDADLQHIEKKAGGPVANNLITAFVAMDVALQAGLQLPDDKKALLWTNYAPRWNKLREGACAGLASPGSEMADGEFTPEDLALMAMYAGGKYGHRSTWNAQDHILRIMEGMDDETVAAFVEEFDRRWQALQDIAGGAESTND